MYHFFVLLFLPLASLAFLAGCGGTKGSHMTKELYGTLPDGTVVDLYTLKNGQGMEAKIITYGGIVVSLRVPDRAGALDDVVLGYDSLSSYVAANPYFGALIGRYGNRIANGEFTLDGVRYALAKNDGVNHLHGGLRGFDKVVWKAEPVTRPDGEALVLTYISKDGEEGYPGTLYVQVTYVVTDSNELRIEYSATSDRATHVNLTHHSYFHLGGAGRGDILSHVLMIRADQFTPVRQGLIPTGELRDVTGTPLDFRKPTPIGARIGADDEQLRLGLGYDHNWVLNKMDNSLALAARVTEPVSGRVMEVYTQEPGLQFYSGNFLNGTNIGKRGIAYQYRWGFCLESQHFPDSPNNPQFPSTLLEPGRRYQTTTVYRFSTE
jgi:aldose 1-epimerase